MYTDIVINATPYENRIAVVERGNLLEFHLERPTEKGLVGNIYQGKVVRVLPGMQAAFIDIGLDRTGFLYVDDIDTSMSMSQLSQQEAGLSPVAKNGATNLAIEELVKEGQTILVQIAKEPIGSKGARLTCHITLPCRNLVFMPLTDHIGISRKIEDEDVREGLRERLNSYVLRAPVSLSVRLQRTLQQPRLKQIWNSSCCFGMTSDPMRSGQRPPA